MLIQVRRGLCTLEMTKQLDSFIQKTNQASELWQLDHHFAESMKQLGFCRFTYTKHIHHDFSHAFQTHPIVKWSQHFWEERYDGVDPIGNRVKHEIVPVYWNLEEALSSAKGRAICLFSDALDYGFKTGVSIPIRGLHHDLGILVLHDEEKILAHNDSVLGKVYLLALHYHARIVQLQNKDHIVKPKITPP